MKQLKEMSKDKLMKLIMKYYKSINSKNDLVNELLENFEVDLNTFSKTTIHKLIYNYYNGLTEAQLRKEVIDNFEYELPKKKVELFHFELELPKKKVEPKKKELEDLYNSDISAKKNSKLKDKLYEKLKSLFKNKKINEDINTYYERKLNSLQGTSELSNRFDVVHTNDELKKIKKHLDELEKEEPKNINKIDEIDKTKNLKKKWYEKTKSVLKYLDLDEWKASNTEMKKLYVRYMKYLLNENKEEGQKIFDEKPQLFKNYFNKNKDNKELSATTAGKLKF